MTSQNILSLSAITLIKESKWLSFLLDSKMFHCCSVCNIFLCTWYKPVHVEVETLSWILSLSNKGTPSVSQPVGPSRDCLRPDTRFWVSCVPLVTRLQWSASSAEVRCHLTSLSEGLPTPWRIISFRLAVVSSWRSPSSHLKTHRLSLPMKMLYSGCLSVVQPEGNRLMKCHMSNLKTVIVYYDKM